MDRIARLERRIRILIGTVVGLSAVVVLLACVAAAPPVVSEIVRCRCVEIVDDDGKLRAVFGYRNDAPLALTMRDKDRGASIGFTENGARLSISGPKGVLFADVDHESAPSICITNPAGDFRTLILDGQMRLYDESGKVFWAEPHQ